MCGWFQIMILQYQEKPNFSLAGFMLAFLLALILSIVIWQVCYYRRQDNRYKNIEIYIEKEIKLNLDPINNILNMTNENASILSEALIECNCIQTYVWDTYKTELILYLLANNIDNKNGKQLGGRTQGEGAQEKYFQWTRLYELLKNIYDVIGKRSDLPLGKLRCQQFIDLHKKLKATNS